MTEANTPADISLAASFKDKTRRAFTLIQAKKLDEAVEVLRSMIPSPLGTNADPSVHPSGSKPIREFDSVVELKFWEKSGGEEFELSKVRLNDAYQYLTFAYFELHQFDKALEVIEAGLKRAPLKIDLLFEKIEILKQQSKFEEAKELTLQCFARTWRAQFIAKLYRNIGFLEVEKQNWDLATACLLHSLNFHNTKLAIDELTYILSKTGWTAPNVRSRFTPDAIAKLLGDNNIPGPSLIWEEVARELQEEAIKNHDLHLDKFCCQVIYEVTGLEEFAIKLQKLSDLIEQLKLKPEGTLDAIKDGLRITQLAKYDEPPK